MKLSLSWIRDYVNIPEDADLKKLAYDLTMSTVEVEDVEYLAERFVKYDRRSDRKDRAASECGQTASM